MSKNLAKHANRASKSEATKGPIRDIALAASSSGDRSCPTPHAKRPPEQVEESRLAWGVQAREGNER